MKVYRLFDTIFCAGVTSICTPANSFTTLLVVGSGLAGSWVDSTSGVTSGSLFLFFLAIVSMLSPLNQNGAQRERVYRWVRCFTRLFRCDANFKALEYLLRLYKREGVLEL